MQDLECVTRRHQCIYQYHLLATLRCHWVPEIYLIRPSNGNYINMIRLIQPSVHLVYWAPQKGGA